MYTVAFFFLQKVKDSSVFPFLVMVYEQYVKLFMHNLEMIDGIQKR